MMLFYVFSCRPTHLLVVSSCRLVNLPDQLRTGACALTTQLKVSSDWVVVVRQQILFDH